MLRPQSVPDPEAERRQQQLEEKRQHDLQERMRKEAEKDRLRQEMWARRDNERKAREAEKARERAKQDREREVLRRLKSRKTPREDMQARDPFAAAPASHSVGYRPAHTAPRAVVFGAEPLPFRGLHPSIRGEDQPRARDLYLGTRLRYAPRANAAHS